MDYHDWMAGTRRRRRQARALSLINYQGYKVLYKPNHHRARKDGYVLESVYLWEIYNVACLLPWARIFHLNKNKLDNSKKNLIAMCGNTIRHL